jgi:hypothetical protein
MSITSARVFQISRLCVCLSFFPGLMACTTARMACPPELLASAVEMPVTGRQGFGLSESFSFAPPGKEKSWKMVMKQETEDRVMDGFLSDGAVRISLKGTRKLAGTTLPLTEATGYLFYGDQGLVGAVDVLNQGSVWIAKDLPDPMGTALAAAASALLLYRDLRE